VRREHWAIRRQGYLASSTTPLPRMRAGRRAYFVSAVRDFKGTDFGTFWRDNLPVHPEFKDKPELISRLILTQQLTALSENHQALVRELRVNRGVASVGELMAFEHGDWIELGKLIGRPWLEVGIHSWVRLR